MDTITRSPDHVSPPADVVSAPVEHVLAPPPAFTDRDRRGQEVFRAVNRWATVPMLRAGLGPWLGTPVGGYLLILRARGRSSGVVRETPLSYLIADGAVWVCAGFGPAAQWYRNILADPRVEVVLPGRTVVCVAEDVRDPEVRHRMMPALVHAIGMPAALGGVDPRHATDEEILEAYGWVPLVRLAPVSGPLAAGPDDPGGTAWIWRQAVVIGLVLVIARTKLGFIGRLLGRR
jgi:deazaflavin-dependent oxidoreductase (nitroreductase family)